ARRRAQLRHAEALLSLHAFVGSSEHPGHARPAVGELVGETAARAGRRKRAWAVSPRSRTSGADRADDGERFGPRHVGGAGGWRRPFAAAAGEGAALARA